VQRSVGLLGYRVIAEPDGDAGLRACAEASPRAVLLSPFLHGMDPFSFLRHLRQLPGMANVPVLLLVPTRLTDEEYARLQEAAAAAVGDRSWARGLAKSEGDVAPSEGGGAS
jgi:CheY-like chemotaxis protein